MARLATTYALDEDVAVRTPDDYATLCPSSNRLAYGADGVFLIGAPWVLTSATINFEANGVASGCVVAISGGTPRYRGSGELLAIDSATAGVLVLRRLGLALAVGQPPGVGGVTGVTFEVGTFAPQIEEQSFDLNRRYGIDPGFGGREPGDAYDLRELRRLCVLEVLYDRYTSANRTSTGDWKLKIDQIGMELAELRARTSLRWGPRGDSVPPVSPFGTRITR